MKLLFYTTGILILTLGIALTVQSDLGASPFDALLVGLESSVGLTAGSWEVIIGFLLIGLNAMLEKKRPDVLALFTSFTTGAGIDLWLFICRQYVVPDGIISKLLCFGAGLFFIGLGTAVYLQAEFAPNPIDLLTLVLKKLLNASIFLSRTVIYVICLILSLLFQGPVGIGTLLTVAFGGAVLNFCMPVAEKVYRRLAKNSDHEQSAV